LILLLDFRQITGTGWHGKAATDAMPRHRDVIGAPFRRAEIQA
jgi:hypothetical protein